MKTEQEIQEADRKDQEIRVKSWRKEKAAQLAFDKATNEESEEFEKVVRPAQERWKTFSAPYRESLRLKLLDIRKEKDDAITELQVNWENCPKCGTSYGRYQVYCSNDKCQLNLVLEKSYRERIVKC